MSQPRLLVWLLRELGGHYTADEVAGQLAAVGQLSRATVYNVLRNEVRLTDCAPRPSCSSSGVT